MAISISLLVFDSESQDTIPILRSLKNSGLSPIYKMVNSLPSFLDVLSLEDWDLILFLWPEGEPDNLHSILNTIKDLKLDIAIVAIAPQNQYPKAVSYMKQGLTDVVMKESLERLTEILERERRELVQRREKSMTESFLHDSLREIQHQQFALDQANIVSITDPNGIIQYVNDAFCKATGYTKEELIGQNHRILKSVDRSKEDWKEMWETISRGNVWKGEIHNTKKDGSSYWVDTTIVPFRNPDKTIQKYIAIHHDITDRKVYEQQLTYDAFYDNLTGLPNRALFLARIEQKISEYIVKKDGFPILFCVNLDNFKRINHSIGHDGGDQILKIFADRLLTSFGSENVITRLGADNFAILMTQILSVEEGIAFLQRKKEDWEESIPYHGYEIYVTASCGVATYGMGGKDGEELLRNAEIAMFHAKSSKVGSNAVFSQTMRDHIHYQLEIQNDLKKALKESQIFVTYQPIYSFEDKKVHHWEALVRWRHPQRGMVSPAEFIPLAEDSGLIVPITKFVLNEVARMIQAIYLEKGQFISIAVNLSPQVFLDHNIFHWIVELHKTKQIPYACLQVEITESVAMKNMTDTMPILKNLLDIGVQVALDDFGTGFSSLSYLEKLPLSILKIDKSFLPENKEQLKEAQLVRSIIEMAHGLGYKVVAEGVEDKEQWDFLAGANCDMIQGYFLSKPLTEEHILPFFTSFSERKQSL